MTPEVLSQQINTGWTLIAAFLVFFMQAGFGMLEAGMRTEKYASQNSNPPTKK